MRLVNATPLLKVFGSKTNWLKTEYNKNELILCNNYRKNRIFNLEFYISGPY